MFDHTLDNMSIHDENNTVSELLREKGMPPSSSRGRFISDESFLLQGERGSCGQHFLNPNGETPDKSFDDIINKR